MWDEPQDQLALQGIDPLQGKKLFVRKRDGRVEEFNEARISLAIESAFKAVVGIGLDAELDGSLRSAVKKCADTVVERVLGRAVRGEQMEVEKIQDTVEDQLMLDGQLAVARRYILYREQRRVARVEREGRAPYPAPTTAPANTAPPIEALPPKPPVTVPIVITTSVRAARPLLEKIYSQALPKPSRGASLEAAHLAHFSLYINEGEYLEQLAPELMEFDLDLLAGAMRMERDELFPESGLQALYDDFLLQENGRRIETPQYFWMRLAMGLALNEDERRDARAIEFYAALSTFRFVPSETILAHAGTTQPQLVTCCASGGWDSLEHVTAQAGPRLESRRRSGMTCDWLETWHEGIWEFLKRPSSAGPPHDLNKALWVPDLFMKRVRAGGPWTLFDPAAAPDLHQKFGRAFEERYAEYEQMADRGEMQSFQRINAADLWQEILTSLIQTGQPWLGFKDAVNVRSAQDHDGVVRSASLCTAFLLNTSSQEAAACGAGSINLAAHLDGTSSVPLDLDQLQRTVHTALRMLDNAIAISAFPSPAARRTAQEHRPVALGLLGFQDALNWIKADYASGKAADLADHTMEIISHRAILASTALAAERGVYPSYPGSKWSHGVLPVDTIALLSTERGLPLQVNSSTTENWEAVRTALHRHGLRHCTVTAISSNDAGSRITGAGPSIDANAPSEELIECAARRQKWLDMGHTLALYTAERDPAALSGIYMQAWEAGLKTTRQLHHRPVAPIEYTQTARQKQSKPKPRGRPESVSVK